MAKYMECVCKTHKTTGEVSIEFNESDNFWGYANDDGFSGADKEYTYIGLTMKPNETKEHAAERLIKGKMKEVSDKIKSLEKTKMDMKKILEQIKA